MASPLPGERNGERTGIMFFIVVKDAVEINRRNKEIDNESIRLMQVSENDIFFYSNLVNNYLK